MIEFDLRMNVVSKRFAKTQVLMFESPSVRLSFYVNGWGAFRITRHNLEMDTYFNLLDFNLLFDPHTAVQEFNHFVVRIIDNGGLDAKCTVIIDGYTTQQPLQKDIWPLPETVTVWFGTEQFRKDREIKNLVIKSM